MTTTPGTGTAELLEMARRDTGNRTTYWQNKVIAGMRLLRADFISIQFSPHTHDAFVIAVTEAGRRRNLQPGHRGEGRHRDLVRLQSGRGPIGTDGRWRAVALPRVLSDPAGHRRRRRESRIGCDTLFHAEHARRCGPDRQVQPLAPRARDRQ